MGAREKCSRWELTTVNIRLDSFPMDGCMLACSVVFDSETPWTIARQTLLPVEFSQQEYWSGLPFLTLGDLPDPGIKLASPVSPALERDSLPLSYWGSPFSYACIFYFSKVIPCYIYQCLVNCFYHLAVFCGYVFIRICKNLHPMFYLFLKEFKYLLLFLAVLGLHCSVRAFL